MASGEFPEIEQVKRNMDKLSASISNLIHHDKKPFGVHHSDLFKDFLTHSAIVDPSKPATVSSSSDFRPISKPSSSIVPSNVTYLKPETKTPLQSTQNYASKPYDSSTRTFVPQTRTISASPVPPPQIQMTQSFYNPSSYKPIQSSFQKLSHPIRASHGSVLLNQSSDNPLSERSRSGKKVMFADFDRQFSRTMDDTSSRHIGEPRVIVPHRPSVVHHRVEKPPMLIQNERPPILRGTTTPFTRPRSSSIQGTYTATQPSATVQFQSNLNRMHVAPSSIVSRGIPTRIAESESLMNHLASPSVLEYSKSSDRLLQLIQDKFDREKQFVSQEFDSMLTRVIDLTDQVKLSIFSQVDEVAYGVKDLVASIKNQVTDFSRHAAAVQHKINHSLKEAQQGNSLYLALANHDYLDTKAHNYLEVKSLLEDLKQKYHSLGLENQDHELKKIISTDFYAVDKPFLQERISQTSHYLQEAIQELMKSKTSSPVAPLHPPLLSPAQTPESLITPKYDEMKNINFEKTSSSKKPSILKPGKFSSSNPKNQYESNDKEKYDKCDINPIKVSVTAKPQSRLQKNSDVKDLEDYAFESYDSDTTPKITKVQVVEPEAKKPKEAKMPARKEPKEVQRTKLEPRAALDIFLNNHIANPGLWAVSSLPLGKDLVPSCLTVVSPSEVVVGTASGTLLVSDLNYTRRIKISNDPIISIKSLGHLVACCFDSAANNLCIVDIDFPDDLMFMQGHSRAVTDVAWSDGGSHFISVGKDGKLNFWNWDPLSLAKSIKISNLPLNSVACLAKSNLVAVGGDDGCIKVFSISEGSLFYKTTLQDNAAVLKLDSFYQNTKFVASTNLLGELKIWDLSSAE